MTKRPVVSFVIPCYGHGEHLRQTLMAIEAQQSQVDFETIVVYSGWEKSEEPVPQSSERYIVSRKRLFPGEARNRGAREARGQWLAFVDADTTLLPGWIDRMMSESASHPETLLGGFVENENPQTTPSRVLHSIEFSQFLPGLEGGVQRAISTSNCLLPASLFEESGGFDEVLAMSEDWDLCCRLPKPPIFVSTVGVLHSHRSDWGSVRHHLRRLGYWSGWLRRSRPELAGSWLRRFPPACFALVLLRFYRIQKRLGQARAGPDHRYLQDGPALLVGLGAWAWGFWTGIRGHSVPR